ncbi:unnamed protein product [Callosobruchus maculatus]|uniref:Uncharacterized protein n=1 Tax=Callosobruchus maculatus TaxID=64391 RepID=A0A653C1G4_CALMS|nr:unnamed protein product [Callosobruchus maculatus]
MRGCRCRLQTNNNEAETATATPSGPEIKTEVKQNRVILAFRRSYRKRVDKASAKVSSLLALNEP